MPPTKPLTFLVAWTLKPCVSSATLASDRSGIETDAWGLIEPEPESERGTVGDRPAIIVREADAGHSDLRTAAELGFRVRVIPPLPPSFERLLESRGAVVTWCGEPSPGRGLRLSVYYPGAGFLCGATLRTHAEHLRRANKLPGLLGRVAALAAANPGRALAPVETFTTSDGRRGWGVAVE